MSRKFTAQRRRAFLSYLAQTGNITLAAERAKVSRSWVRLHRSTDPAFDAACREAIGEARERIRAAAGAAGTDCPRHSAFPRFHEGEELVVNGSNGRRVQVRRAKLSQWTARTEDRFLRALAASCNVRYACESVGLWPPSAYAHRKRWPDFARRWDEAIAIGAGDLECRLHESIRHFFDRELPEPDAPIRDVTVDDAIRLVRMYQAKGK